MLWIGGAALAALCGFLALLRPVDGITADGAPTVPGAGVLAAWSAAVALGAGIAQIAVHAARWRPPS